MEKEETKEQKKMTKKQKIGIIVYLAVLVFCGACGFPEVIRQIPGEEFVNLWLGGFGGFAAGVGILFFAFALKKYMSAAQKSKSLPLSDVDYMIMQGHSRGKINGYFLLKAKIAGVINLYTQQQSEDSKPQMFLEINHEISEAERGQYCEKNPYVKKIVTHLLELQNSEEEEKQCLSVETFLQRAKLNPEYASPAGLLYKETEDSIRKMFKRMCVLLYLPLFSIGFLKLFMGIFRGKAIGNLMTSMVGCAFLSIFLLLLYRATSLLLEYYLYRKKFMSKIESEAQEGFEPFERSVHDEKLRTIAEKEKALRYFAWIPVNTLKTESKVNGLDSAWLIPAVLLADAAIMQEDSGGDGGCGCSSCSGCGGGCGGCGGCGD